LSASDDGERAPVVAVEQVEHRARLMHDRRRHQKYRRVRLRLNHPHIIIIILFAQ